MWEAKIILLCVSKALQCFKEEAGTEGGLALTTSRRRASEGYPTALPVSIAILGQAETWRVLLCASLVFAHGLSCL